MDHVVISTRRARYARARMRLGTLLLRNATVSPTQLDTALRTQVLCGGRLGTNLVELGFLSIDGLTAHLGELFELPVATSHQLDRVTADTARLLDTRVAERHGMIPLGFLQPFRNALAVAMIDPRDNASIERVAVDIGAPIAPYVVPELRALYYLEKLYGVSRTARYVRPGTRRGTAATDERRRTQPPGGLAAPPPLRIEPRRDRRDSATPGGIGGLPPVDFQSACERVDAATNRDEIAQVFLDFAIARFAALAIFLVRDGNALGWRSYTPAGPTPQPIAELSLPIGGVSALQTANDEGRPYLGPPPSAGHPTETSLWSALGVEPASEVFTAPILARHRVVNLLYAHPLAARGFDAATIQELRQLAERASAAYQRLIHETKHR